MASGNVDLFSLFKQVSKAVQENKTSLNEADTYNHDHGDHMAEIFEVITQAVKDKKNAEPADQLEYAAQLLRKKSNSGSATIYAEGLGKAAKQITGKELNAGSIISILATILGSSMGSSSQSSSGGGMLGSLLGSLAGGASANSGGDMLGSLLGSLAGGSSADSGGDMLGSLLGSLAGGASADSGEDTLGSLLGSLTGELVSGSQVAKSSPARAQSSELITSTLLNALSSMASK